PSATRPCLRGDPISLPLRHNQTMRSARVATVLWIVWALVVWNVVFDRVVVLAGRRYVYAAALAAHTGLYLHIDRWMRLAVVRGIWLATGSAGVILVIGFALIAFAVRREAS